MAGVGTYLLRADGVPDTDITPIYLDMHGGALIFGAGGLSRDWGSMTAATTRMITWSIDYRHPPLHPSPAALDDCFACTGRCSSCVTQPTSLSAAHRPVATSLFADLSGFPPTFLSSGTRDLLLSNTVRMHRKRLAAGIEAELHIFGAMPHGGFDGSTPEDIELDAAIRGFLDKHRRAS